MPLRIRTAAPLFGLFALLALLLMPHQSGVHSGSHALPGLAASAAATAADSHKTPAPVRSHAREVSSAAPAQSLVRAAMSTADEPVGRAGVTLSLSCAVLLLAAVLLRRPALTRTASHHGVSPRTHAVRARRSGATSSGRNLLTEICVSRT